MTPRHVACVVEGDYLPHTAAMLHSLLAHDRSGEVHVHYLHAPGFDQAALRKLGDWLAAQGAVVSFHEVPDERCVGLPTEGFTGKATWYRIFLPELLPDVDRVLFLDADVIVRDDLGELWELDLGDDHLAAVTNVFPPEYADRPAAIGLRSPDEYFNAGVLLMNLDAMRRDGCTEALYAYGVEHAGELVLRDQDALNAVLARRRRELHPRWNAMNMLRFPMADAVFGADAVAEARRAPKVRHFEGPADNKPWHRGCDRDDRELYFAHRRATPWPRVRLEGSRGLRAPALVAAALLVWSLIPLAILLVDVARHGGVLSGSDGALAGSDQQLYLTWIRESGTDVLISNEYRLGESAGVFFHPMFLISGLLWQLGVGLKLSLLLWKPVAAALLGAGAWLYAGRFLEGRARVTATVLGLFFFSPVLPLLVWSGIDLPDLDHLLFLFTSNESMPAIQLWGYLHAAVVVGAMALFVLGAERIVDARRRRGGRGRTWYVGWTSAAGLLIGWMHPWQGATLIALLVALAAWGRLAPRYRILAVPAAAIAAPMLWEWLLIQFDPDWSIDAQQNAGSHAPLWVLAAALGPLVLPALAGARARLADDGGRMLLLWPVAALAVYGATDQFPYHALQGLSIPLAVLAVDGLARLRVPLAAGAAFVVLVTAPGIAFVVDTFLDSRRAGIAPYILDPGEADALRFLEDAPPGGVLARTYLGATVPSLAGQETWVGQFTWTPDYDARREAAERLFSGALDPGAAQELVRRVRPRYLLGDCRVAVDLAPLLGDVVTRTHRFGCATVYEVDPP